MGLREKHKKQRRRGILAAAKQLFVHNGYAATSMQGIAARSDVSVGTLYNYFSSKQRLMLAVVREDAESLYESPMPTGKDPFDAVYEYLCRVVDFTLGYGRDLVRELVIASIAEAHSEMGVEMMEMDWRFVGKLTELFQNQRRSGSLLPGADSSRLAWICYSLLMTELILLTFDPHRTEKLLKDSLRESVKTVLRGNLKGNG
ncbi:TetR family transcriptional regulator [Candidatus Fermentibacteria bacterium]|nr:TetR family transcriptional regulator [Candidatus Fermentibacteria bacterium]